jgi:L-rhamnose mutarotase
MKMKVKVALVLNYAPRHDRIWGEMDVYLHVFLTSASD